MRDGHIIIGQHNFHEFYPILVSKNDPRKMPKSNSSLYFSGILPISVVFFFFGKIPLEYSDE